MILFSEIADTLHYPRDFKRIKQYHSVLIDKYISQPPSTRSECDKIVSQMNAVSVSIVNGDFLPDTNDADSIIENLDLDVSGDVFRKYPELYIDARKLTWDILADTSFISEISNYVLPDNIVAKDLIESQSSEINEAPVYDDSVAVDEHPVEPSIPLETHSTKEDLYVQGPKVFRFDASNPWLYQQDGSDVLAIYTSLPIVPTRQCEISVTTDIRKMTDSDCVKLFPDTVIRTRSSIMYEREISSQFNLTYDSILGIIFPITSFTVDQVRDNILKYPHLFKLQKWVNKDTVNMYSTVEIDGQLVNICEAWSSLPDTSYLPKNKDFMKEYVTRRYLLERDILHLKHSYPMLGTLDPFMTLFMPVDMYASYGYPDAIDISKQCVNSRVSFLRTRNPILRRLGYYD